MTPCLQPSDLYTLIKNDPEFIKRLTPLQKLVLRYRLRVRPDQIVPAHAWRYCGFLCGRGWGKSWNIARELNQRVRAGMVKNIALVGPTEDRTREVCVKFLIDLSPPWFKAVEDRGGVLWPNGARAYVYTAEVAEVRGPNFDHAWATEVCFWPSSTGDDCFNNVTTATREGARQVFWDTTSKGKNALVLKLLAMHESNPTLNPLVRGTIFDNEWYDRTYLQSEWAKYTGRRRDEEMLGIVFSEAPGALWEQGWIDTYRVPTLPPGDGITLISLDPATTSGRHADAFGFSVATGIAGHVYLRKDRSERMKPEVWGARVIDEYELGATGVVVEVTGNSGGDSPLFVIRTFAEAKGFKVREWPEKMGPFPARHPEVLYVREVQAKESKEDRADPAAALTERGRVHVVGSLTELEIEMTTWVPGDRKSPNRLDAAVRNVIELSGVSIEKPAATPEQSVNRAHDANELLRKALAERAGTRKVW